MTVSIASSVAEAATLLADAPSPVVVIAVYDAYDDVVRCVDAVIAHTPAAVAILVVDDGGADRRVLDLLAVSSGHVRHCIVVLRHEHNQGFVRSCNDAFAATSGRDVVVLNSDVIVGAEWLDRLQDAAMSSDTIATATSLTNHGTILSVPDRNGPTTSLPEGITPDEAARRVAAASRRLRPAIPTAVGHCFYLRRDALDLVGGFDEAFDPGYGEEVDFSQRAVAHGFHHVVADDVFTFHRGGGSFGHEAGVDGRRARHEAIVRQRYPWYGRWVDGTADDTSSALADALNTARRALLGLTVGVDALCLGPHQMGTQHIVVETIRALAARPEISRLVAFVPLHAHPYVVALRQELPAVEFIGVNPFLGSPERVVDLIYRPYQVSDIVELDFLARAADRLVVNQLDVIAFHNPAYFATADQWLAYRDLTRLTLELAHGVAFLSDRSRDAVLAEGLVRSGTPMATVSCGVDAAEVEHAGTRPPMLEPDDAGFLLCIGASYLHKNRRLALEIWAELRRRRWNGRIVLAGPTPPSGNSLSREAELLLGRSELRADVVTLGAVSDAEKCWLYRHAALVLYPSTVEGFGLVPFEAAWHGVATLATRRGSLDEVLPDGIPVLDGFDVDKGADQAWDLLHDPDAASKLVAALRAHSSSFTWDAAAEKLVALFDDALRAPRGRVLVLEGEGDHPIGLMARSQRPTADASHGLERFVQAVLSRPGLKNSLSPDGSRRQRVTRSVISQARRQLR